MRMSTMIRVALAACALSLIGCSYDLTRDDAVGSYVIHYDFGVELLRLDDNGRYVQVVLLDTDTVTVSNSGTWTCRSDGFNNTVVLDGGLCIDDGFGHLGSDWHTRFPGLLGIGFLVQRLGRIRLVHNEDIGLEYLKIK